MTKHSVKLHKTTFHSVGDRVTTDHPSDTAGQGWGIKSRMLVWLNTHQYMSPHFLVSVIIFNSMVVDHTISEKCFSIVLSHGYLHLHFKDFNFLVDYFLLNSHWILLNVNAFMSIWCYWLQHRFYFVDGLYILQVVCIILVWWLYCHNSWSNTCSCTLLFLHICIHYEHCIIIYFLPFYTICPVSASCYLQSQNAVFHLPFT